MTFRPYHASILALVVAAWPLAASAGSDAAPMPRFSTMEGQMPTDSLKPSSDPLWKTYSTRQSRMDPMRSEIRAAIPVGMSAQTAMDRLQQAGAHCRSVSPQLMACDYHTAQTRDEFLDDVHWNVDVGLRNGAVQQLSIQRNWFRS